MEGESATTGRGEVRSWPRQVAPAVAVVAALWLAWWAAGGVTRESPLRCLQVPGEAWSPDRQGRFLVVGVRNVDPQAPLGHETGIIEVLAVFPGVGRSGRKTPTLRATGSSKRRQKRDGLWDGEMIAQGDAFAGGKHHEERTDALPKRTPRRGSGRGEIDGHERFSVAGVEAAVGERGEGTRHGPKDLSTAGWFEPWERPDRGAIPPSR